jgi:hypothetical protein
MTEIIINYPNKAALVRLATALGYYDPVGKAITTQGAIATGGSYFFNNVGVVYQPTGNMVPSPMGGQMPEMSPLPGFWARLRHNGDQAILDGHMSPQIMAQAAALGVTIYKRATINGQSVWTADGTTAGPAYLDTIGVIA